MIVLASLTITLGTIGASICTIGYLTHNASRAIQGGK